MTDEQKKKCHTIIHSSACLVGTIGAGFAQLPCSDNAAIVPVQLAMIISLGSVFGIRLQQSKAESMLGTATATILGRNLSKVLVGWIPVFGNAFNAATGAGVTELIGWAIANDFASRSRTKSKRKGDH